MYANIASYKSKYETPRRGTALRTLITLIHKTKYYIYAYTARRSRFIANHLCIYFPHLLALYITLYCICAKLFSSKQTATSYIRTYIAIHFMLFCVFFHIHFFFFHFYSQLWKLYTCMVWWLSGSSCMCCTVSDAKLYRVRHKQHHRAPSPSPPPLRISSRIYKTEKEIIFSQCLYTTYFPSFIMASC